MPKSCGTLLSLARAERNRLCSTLSARPGSFSNGALRNSRARFHPVFRCERARKLFLRAWRRCRRHHLRALGAAARHNLLALCIETGRFEEAQEHAEAAYEL